MQYFMFVIPATDQIQQVCSAFPTTGGLYFWTAQLSDSNWVPFMCWIVGKI